MMNKTVTSLNTGVRHGLSAQLQNSIKILSLSQLDLKDRILHEVEENPFIEESRSNKELSELPVQETADSYSYDFESERKGDFIESILTGEVSLQDYLFQQISLSDIRAEIIDLARLIISSLNTNGFTRYRHYEIASSAGYNRAQLRDTLDYIRQLDPVGVAAEDIWQALTWQANAYFPDDIILPDLIEILRRARSSLIRFNLRERLELAETLGLSEEQVNEKIEKLQHLDPFPARNFEKIAENNIYPEVHFLDNGENIDVIVREKLIPELNLNKALFEEIRNSDENEGWKQKFHEAENLIKSINYRKDTLARVSQAILIKQRNFFLKGTTCLQPLNLSDVASVVDLHISTVSRLVSNKYCQCKWGIFPLKYFFPSRLKSNDGSNKGIEDMKQAILSVLAVEDDRKPYSDSALTQILNQRGFDVQRRTVAKYRKLLHIPSANERKVKI